MVSNAKRITILGVGIALYVVLSFILNFPIVGHVRFDAGYVCYAVYLSLFGWWGIPVGVVGCFIKGYISDGWIPFTWMIGQLIVGVTCAVVFRKTNDAKHRIFYRAMAVTVSVTVGIGIVSSLLSAVMFGQPIMLKIGRGMITAAADILPMVIGLVIAEKLPKAPKMKEEEGK